MKSVAFKNIWAHKFRILSLFCIIAAGTGFIAGALVLGATMTRTFNDLFGSVYANTDAVVRAKAPFDSGNGNADAARPPVPVALLGQVKQVPDVAAAVGNVSITAQAIDAQGKVISTGGAPNFGFNWSDETWANPYRIAEGTPPQADDQVVIDRGIAKKLTSSVATDSSIEVLTGKEVIKENEDAINQFFKVFTIVLLVFAGVAVVGMFVIYNTFGILVAQRTRETALLRALGASAAQVLRSVVVESVVIGFIGSALGVLFGIVLAVLLKAVFSALGVDLPAGGIAITEAAIIAPLVVGVITTLVSAFVPAWRSSRVPPLAAIQDVAIDRSGHSAARSVTGAILLVLGVFALVGGLAGGTVALVGVAFLLVILGVAVIGPVFARPFTRLIGAPLPAARGMTGTLARENASRNPKRTSATAMALTIGVAIVAFIIVMATSIKASVAGEVDKQFAADYVVEAKGFGPGFSPQLNQQLKQLPEVDSTSALRFNQAQIDGQVKSIIAVEPASITSVFNFGRVSGDFTALSGDGIAVSEDSAKSHNWALGSKVQAVFVNITKDLSVDAIYERNTVAGNYVIGLPTYEAGYNEQFDNVVMVKTKTGADQVAFRTGAENLLKSYPSAKIETQKEFKDSQAGQINGLVLFVYVLLALAIIVALIGIGTTLALSVHERTRELGLLRAVGQFRGQTRGTVRWESAIVAVFGTLIGLVVGVAFGIAIVHALADQGLNTLSIPVPFLIIMVIVAGFAGVLASLWPASRAAKLDILNAIAAE